MRLYHSETGEPLDMAFRPFRPADAKTVIACLREAYDDTYVKPYLYTEEGVVRCWETGELVFTMAETAAGEPIGMIGNQVSHEFFGQNEFVTQVILRRYKGFGIAEAHIRYNLARLEEEGRSWSALFGHALGCHPISQLTFTHLGFTACGFLLSVFDKAKFRHRYYNGNYAKIPQAIIVQARDRRDAGTFFVPPGLTPLLRETYRSLGVAHRFTQEAPPLAGETVLTAQQDGAHRSLTLFLRRPGADTAALLDAALSPVAGLPDETVNLFLNLSAPGAGRAWELLRARGFFFTGAQPCCADGEYLALHHPLSVPVRTREIPCIDPFEPFLEEIRREAHEA